MQYHFKNETDERFYDIDYSDKDKCVVICVAKNENEYIREWIDHNLSIGFDKIIIGDNNDDNSLSVLLSDYIEKGTVALYNCKGFKKFQGQFYTMFSTVGIYKWAAYFDCDEFLEIPLFDNIKDYLDTVSDDCISFNWITMSNENALIKKDGGVKERFKTPLLPLNFQKYNLNVKSIIRGGKSFVFSDPHVPEPNQEGLKYNYYGTKPNGIYHGMYADDIDYRVGYIRHYTCKSFEECLEKARRGYPDGGKVLGPDIIWKACNITTQPTIDEYVDIDVNVCGYVFEQFEDYINEYKYLKIEITQDASSFGILRNILKLMSKTNDKVIIFERNIPTLLYSIILGYSFETTNKVLTVSDNFDDYIRATDGLKPNYIIKCKRYD